MSLAGTVIRGALAAAVGTLAMDLLRYRQYQQEGGESGFMDYELALGTESWQDASAPGKVGKLLYETATRSALPDERAMLTTNLMHWAYGLSWGMLYALAQGRKGQVRAPTALLLGPLVWLAGYVSLPVGGFYKPLWEYDPPQLSTDLASHMVYGTVTGLSYWLLSR